MGETTRYEEWPHEAHWPCQRCGSRPSLYRVEWDLQVATGGAYELRLTCPSCYAENIHVGTVSGHIWLAHRPGREDTATTGLEPGRAEEGS